MFIFDPSLVPECPANGLWSHQHVFGWEKLTPWEPESHASLLNACLFFTSAAGQSILFLLDRTCNHQKPEKRPGQFAASTAEKRKGCRGKRHRKNLLSVRVFNPFAEKKPKKSVNSWNAWEQNDVSGRCTVAYQAEKHRVTRTKLLETCKTAETGFTTHSQVSGPRRTSSRRPESRRAWNKCVHPFFSRCWVWAGSPALLQCSRFKTGSSAPPLLRKRTR